MSFLDKLKSLFSGGSDTGAGGVQRTPEPDAARADDTHAGHEPVAPPMPPADPAGMPTGEPQPGEPQPGEPQPSEPQPGESQSGGSESTSV